MPFLYWRYTLVELWRLILLTAAVLVSVIAFAATIKPLADGSLGPLEAVRFMALASVPMLSYALPFAGGFGATLAYHRMAQDNETLAAHAGGLSHRALLLPALLTGVVLAVGLGVLNEQVIPRFLRRMERMVTLDAANIVVRQIERGEAAKFDNMMVYADAVARVPPRPGTAALEHLRLTRAAAIETDREGRVTYDAACERAWLTLLPPGAAGEGLAGEAATLVMLRLEQGSGAGPGGTQTIGVWDIGPFRVPDAFEDDPKFLTWGELRSLRGEPERMTFVESRRMNLARALAGREAGDAIATRLAEEGQLTLRTAGGISAVVTAEVRTRIRTGGERLTRRRPGERVVVEVYEPEGRDATFLEADEALLLPAKPAAGGALAPAPAEGVGLLFTLRLENLRIRGPGSTAADRGAVATERSEYELEGLTLLSDPLARRSRQRAAELIEDAAAHEQRVGEDRFVAGLRENLDQRIVRLGREITSKQHERLAMASACLVMVVAGAVIALRLRDRLPLVVYLGSFFPALGAVILIAAGQQICHDESETIGLSILWSGVASLAAFAFSEFIRLARR